MNRTRISIISLVIYSFCAAVVAGEQYDLPETCQQAIDLIIENLDAESREILISIDKEELKNRRFTTSWGKGIREGFGINEGNMALMKSCQARRENATFHPVVISAIIMEEVWTVLNKQLSPD